MADPIANIIAGRMGNLRERQFEYKQQRDEVADALASQREARAQAIAESQLALEAIRLQQETQEAYDTADFLKHFQAVKHTDPRYEDKVAALAATFPLAGGNKNVQAIVGVRNTARKDYMDAIKTGGMYDFAEGTPRNVFRKTFDQTGDLNAARAAAKQDQEQLKSVREAVAQGHLTNDDFTVQPGQPPPPTLNQDGSINYQNALNLAAGRAGKTTGKAAQEVDKDLASAQSFVLSYLKNQEAGIEPDPTAAQLYTIYANKLLSYEQSKTAANKTTVAPQGAVQPGAAPAAAQPGAAPEKAKFVKQNGITYTLQPDGTYKP